MGTRCELNKRELQLYLKRLRKRIGKFRYFAIGEYGDQTLRPHYHLILFGVSPMLASVVGQCWSVDSIPIGFVHVGEVNEHSARYIAGYTTSKVTKRENKVLIKRSKEFMVCSKQDGGIGIEAARAIAASLKKHAQNLGIIRTIKIGGKEKALGRYLTKKLAKFMDVPDSEFDQSFWIHQEALFRTFHTGTGYIERIRKWMEPKLNAKEKRHKIYGKRKVKI